MLKKQIAFSLLCAIILTLTTSTTANAQIQAGEKDTSKYYTVTSEDGIDVPVPYGFCPSNLEDERYVNGKIENKTGKIIATLPTENLTNWAYEDVTINGETSKYWYNTTTEDCTISTNVFEIGENGGAVDINWSSSCGDTIIENERKSKIELVKIENEVEIDSDVIDVICGTKLGTSLSNLSFEDLKKELTPGTYRIDITYKGKDISLAKAFIKKCNVVSYDQNGSYVVENIKTKSGGFVIYELDNFDGYNLEGLNETELKNKFFEIQKEVNQFVFIPVNNEDFEKMYWESSDGKYLEGSFVFNNSSIGASNKDNSFALLQSYDWQKRAFKKQLKGLNRNDWYCMKQNNFIQIQRQIKTYNGFYIGRYETSNKSSYLVTSKRMADAFHCYSYPVMRTHANALNDSVMNDLLYDCHWEMVLKFLVDSQEKSCYDIISSTSWRYYYDSELKLIDKNNNYKVKGFGNPYIVMNSGGSEYTVANSIYDLARNSCEMVKSMNKNDPLLYTRNRGGAFYVNGSSGNLCNSYSSTGKSPLDSWSNYSSRLMMVIA